MQNSTLNLNEAPSREPGGGPRRGKTLLVILIFIVLLAGAWYFFSSDTAWHAVFLANNQVYFGHFRYAPFASTITLRDVYYLQITQPSQQLSGENQSQLKLVKLGNEIHGPTSEMVIPLTEVMFTETLRNDSAIVKTIEQAAANK